MNSSQVLDLKTGRIELMLSFTDIGKMSEGPCIWGHVTFEKPFRHLIENVKGAIGYNILEFKEQV